MDFGLSFLQVFLLWLLFGDYPTYLLPTYLPTYIPHRRDGGIRYDIFDDAEMNDLGWDGCVEICPSFLTYSFLTSLTLVRCLLREAGGRC